MTARRLVLLLSLAALAAGQKVYQPKQEQIPGPPVPQPVAYSHRVHIANGLKCSNCHTMSGEGFQAGYPKESVCMGCHATIRKDSPEIQKLARFAGAKQAVPWVRVYSLPEIVWFNHASHVKDKGIECGVCHGDVKSRDVLFQEKSTSMKTCMDCHAERKAPNGCDFCHASQ